MDLPEVAATLRSYVSRSGTLQAVAATPAGLVVCDGAGHVTLQEPDEDPVELDWRAAEPLDLGVELKRLPAFDVDAEKGEVTSVLGGLEHVADGVAALAAALGAPIAVLVWLPTADEETELVISGREGEGLVVVIGDEQYELGTAGEGWPPQRPAS
jgi:hypothetical protein